MQAASDGSDRPLFPSAFVTDITSSSTNRAGDWQQRNDNTSATAPNDTSTA
jgi:hypothetical protein